MKHLKEYSDEELRNLSKDLKSAGFKEPLPKNLTPDNFFDETIDHDEYVDVSGPACGFIIEDAISDIKERIADIPLQHREVANKAIANLWKDRIEQEML